MICSTCQQDKPLHEFHPNRRFKTGYSTVCQACFLARPDCLICIECGSEKPLTDFRKQPERRTGYAQPCKPCYATAIRDKRAANPEEVREKDRLYYAKNLPKKRAKNLAYNEKNRDKRRASGRSRYAQDSQRFQEEARQRRAANPEQAREKVRRSYHENPAKVRLISSRRQARKRGLPDTFTLAERQFMFQYWGHACAICGRQEGLFGLTLSEDHWIALANPACPGTVATNMLPLCNGTGGCNGSKKAKEGKAWLLQRIGKSKAARIFKAIQTYFDLVHHRTNPDSQAAD